jgi:hypothetical protein
MPPPSDGYRPTAIRIADLDGCAAYRFPLSVQHAAFDDALAIGSATGRRKKDKRANQDLRKPGWARHGRTTSFSYRTTSTGFTDKYIA